MKWETNIQVRSKTFFFRLCLHTNVLYLVAFILRHAPISRRCSMFTGYKDISRARIFRCAEEQPTCMLHEIRDTSFGHINPRDTVLAVLQPNGRSERFLKIKKCTVPHHYLSNVRWMHGAHGRLAHLFFTGSSNH